MSDLDLSVYLVTDPSARRGVVETAVAAVRGGATVVQLRDKSLSDAAYVGLGRAVRAALEPFGTPLLVNDRVALAAAIGAQGAHIGQSDVSPIAARAALGPHAILGLSIEKPAQVDRVPPGVDYLGVGPLKPTTTKSDAAAPLGLDALAQICARTALPCVAIGGLTAADAAAVKARGAAGLAVVSAICAAADPEAATRDILDAWRSA